MRRLVSPKILMVNQRFDPFSGFFGRVAAKSRNLFICLLEEHEILRMKRGDIDLHDTIQDYRQVWKRYALEGLSSSFVILFDQCISRGKEPGPQLKEICRRLLELYMELDHIDDDTFHTQREYVFLKKAHPQLTVNY